MAVTFANSVAIQPKQGIEVAVASIAGGPFDNVDALVSGGGGGIQLQFRLYATVGTLRTLVAQSNYGGPPGSTPLQGTILEWSSLGKPVTNPVHAGGTQYDLVVYGQNGDGPTVLATLAGSSAYDVSSATSVTVAFPALYASTTITTNSGYSEFADVGVNQSGLAACAFDLFASCGAGSVEALVQSQTVAGSDGLTSILREISLPVSTTYRLAVRNTGTVGSGNVTASLATYTTVASGSGGGGSQIIVADQATASALTGLADGTCVFTLTQRAIWTFEKNSTLPLDTGRCLASASGGRLLRTTYSDPIWRYQITDVYVDPTNASGVANDENQAFFGSPQVGVARQPLLTWSEFYLRTRSSNLWTSGDAVNGLWNIHVLSDIDIFASPQTKQISSIDFLADVDTFPFIEGTQTAIYVNTTLDNPGGFIAQNPASPTPGGTACQIKVTAQVWAPYVGYKVLFPGTGAVATLLKDLGGGVARISQPVLLDTTPAAGNTGPTATNPADGDVVQIVIDTFINPGFWRSRFSGTSSNMSGLFATSNVSIYLDSQSTLWTVDNAGSQAAFGIVGFYGVATQRVILHGANVIWNGCQFTGGYQSIYGEIGGAIWGCGMVPLDNRNHIFLSGKADHAANRGVLDYDTYLQNCGVIAMGPLQLGRFSVWDAIITGDNSNGDAVSIGQGINERVPSNTSFTASGVGIVWGSGSIGFGVHLQSNSTLSYEVTPNITGTEGDFAVGDGGVGVAWDPVLLAYTTNRYCTWPNLAALVAVGGFSGNAHNLQQNAHVVPSTYGLPGPTPSNDWDASQLLLVDGAPVSTWSDRIASVAVTQATPAKQPTFHLSDVSYNHHSSVSFLAASSQYLASALGALALVQPYTFFIVGNDDGVAGTGEVYISQQASTRYYDQNGVGTYDLADGATLNDPTAASANPSVIALVCNGATSRIYHSAKTPTATGDAGVTNWTDMVFGIFSDLASDPLNGKLARVLVYDGALDEPTIQAILHVLGWTYGIAIGA